MKITNVETIYIKRESSPVRSKLILIRVLEARVSVSYLDPLYEREHIFIVAGAFF